MSRGAAGEDAARAEDGHLNRDSKSAVECLQVTVTLKSQGALLRDF